MGYVYSLLWFIIAFLLFFQYRKQSRLILPLSIYFFFLGCWWLADQFVTPDLLHSQWTWIIRAVTVVIIGICLLVCLVENKNNAESSADANKKNDNSAE